MVIRIYYRGITLPERGGETDRPSPLEIDIIRSFGWAVVEMEDALYQRYIRISASRSLMPEVTFKAHLKIMEAKGYVSSMSLHGRRAYRRLLVGEDVGRELHPKVPLDEIRLALGSLKTKHRFSKKHRSRVTSDVVKDTETIGQELEHALENWMMTDSGRISRGSIHAHIANMMDALSKSEDSLFEYVRIELPGLLAEIGQILRIYGSDFLLLTLRLTEHRIRKYQF